MRYPIYMLVLLPATCAVLAAPAPAPAPRDGWGRSIDPDHDCKITIKDGTVTMELPGTDHDLAPKRKRFNAPRLLRDAEGDFVMQVRVRAAFRPSDKSSVEGQQPRVTAGIVLIPADENCIRLEYGAYRLGGRLDNGVDFLMQGNKLWNMELCGLSLPWKQEIRERNEEHIYLRLDRRGQEIFRFLSPDGKDWGVGSVSVKIPDLPAKLKVGIAAYSTSTEPFKVRFDQFKLSRGEEKSK